MRETEDGTGDEHILAEYSFTDADGGEPGAESSDEGDDPEDTWDRDADIGGDAELTETEEGDDDPENDPADAAESEGFEGGSDEEDGNETENDDTAEMVGTSINSAVEPDGFKLLDCYQPLDTPSRCQNMIRKNALRNT